MHLRTNESADFGDSENDPEYRPLMSRLWGDRNFWRRAPRRMEELDAGVTGRYRVCERCGRQVAASATTCPVGHQIGVAPSGPVTGGGCMLAFVGLLTMALKGALGERRRDSDGRY